MTDPTRLTPERIAGIRQGVERLHSLPAHTALVLLDEIDALRARLADLEPKYAALAAEVDAHDQATSTVDMMTIDRLACLLDARDAEVDRLRREGDEDARIGRATVSILLGSLALNGVLAVAFFWGCG